IHEVRIFGKPLYRIGVGPTATVLDSLRQVPVIERRRGLDSVLEQRIDETIVKVEASAIRFASPRWQHPRPTDAEAIGAQAEVSHQSHVVDESPVVVAGKVAMLIRKYFARRMCEAMPDA